MARKDAVDELLAHWRSVVEVITRVDQRLMADVELAGVPAQWFGVLRRLLYAEGHRLPMSKLAREVSFTSGGFTKLADRMGREGLIDRRNSDGDRRVVFATLTPAGVAAARTGERAYLSALREHVLIALPDAELAAISAAVAALDTDLLEQGAVLDVDDPAVIATPRDPKLLDRRQATQRDAV
jgi:DNA-binding MarR family transcriptional regulator